MRSAVVVAALTMVPAAVPPGVAEASEEKRKGVLFQYRVQIANAPLLSRCSVVVLERVVAVVVAPWLSWVRVHQDIQSSSFVDVVLAAPALVRCAVD